MVVLWVGTNNYQHTAEQVAGGILAIAELLHSHLPKAKIIVLVSHFGNVFLCRIVVLACSFLTDLQNLLLFIYFLHCSVAVCLSCASILMLPLSLLLIVYFTVFSRTDLLLRSALQFKI